MPKLELVQLSSLEKVMLNHKPEKEEYTKASVLLGEEFAYQIAFWSDSKFFIDVSVKSEIPVTMYEVKNIPSEFPIYENLTYDNYITNEAGLFPDLLSETYGCDISTFTSPKALWFNIKTDENTKAGIYPITVTFKSEEQEILESRTFNLEIIPIALPEQTLIFTQWFHGDCIASYYNEEMLGESHWKHLESFIKTAADHGINMLLTPVFTPPLDTQVGGERPTIQLVKVKLENGKYSFNFDNLKRWIDLCLKCGIKYFEISHLFTQWGAAHAPKIIAEVDGEDKKIFGWETDAVSDEYKEFLNAFLPRLVEFLKQEGIAENTYFHVSDEPSMEHFESYKAAAAIIEPHLEGFKIIDALSNYEFYQLGVLKHPIPSTNHIENFLGIKDLWTYYCCGQHTDVSNRFFAMPSARTRIIGLQFYKFDIKGFLQWGYNFYYSQYSKCKINPYLVTDADGAFPSGDSFSVYPGDDGTAVPSLRLKVFLHALQDMRALQLLETKIPREDIIKLIDSCGEIRFDKYPKEAEFILNFREKVNSLIKENM